MDEWSFNELNDNITEIANGIFGNVETKRKVQKILFKMVALSCQTYLINDDFREQVDEIFDSYKYK